jgi:hypothetical protein
LQDAALGASKPYPKQRVNRRGQKKPRAGRADAGQNSALGLGGKLSAPNTDTPLPGRLFHGNVIFLKKYDPGFRLIWTETYISN